MGSSIPQLITVPNFPIPNDQMIVAPFAADIDTSGIGRVRYAYIDDFFSVLDISTFVRSNTFDDFYSGDSMLVVEWENVTRDGASTVSLLI